MAEDLRDIVEIESPEAVDVEVEVAGLGSRFLAVFLDLVIQALLILAVVAIGALIMSQVPALRLDVLGIGAANAAIILWALGGFLALWGYHVIFEVARNGQTPGKMALDLRVVQEGGRPVTFFASAVRNLLRPIDMVVLAPLTIALMAFTRKHKRLGDWAAGTMVIKERAKVVPTTASPEVGPSAGPGGDQSLTNIELAALGDDELSLMANFLSRRAELEAEPRRRLALEMAQRAAGKMGRDLPDLSPLVCEAFLERVVRASRARN